MNESFRKPHGEKQSTFDRDTLPTIKSALEESESLEVLKKAISTFDADDRQAFLEALLASERFLALENERLSFRTVLKELVPTGVGSAIALLIVLALIPSAVGGVAVGSAALGTADVLKARLQKRNTITRLRELRNAVINAGKGNLPSNHPLTE